MRPTTTTTVSSRVVTRRRTEQCHKCALIERTCCKCDCIYRYINICKDNQFSTNGMRCRCLVVFLTFMVTMVVVVMVVLLVSMSVVTVMTVHDNPEKVINLLQFRRPTTAHSHLTLFVLLYDDLAATMAQNDPAKRQSETKHSVMDRLHIFLLLLEETGDTEH